MSEEESAENNSGTVSRPVGEQLRAARERRGMDRQEVADQLHLRPSIIRAIEESDYETMPADLFLKGYVRSYARLIDQDADDLVARLDQELEPFRQETEESEPSPTEIIRQKKLRRRRIGGAIITALFLMVSGWVVYQYGPWVIGSADDVVDAVGDVELEVPDASSGEEGESEPVDSDSDENDSDENDSGGKEPEEDPAETSSGAGSGSESDSESSAPVALVEEPDTGDESETTEQVVTSESGDDMATLAITFDGACWVEVVNGKGERAVVTLAEEGDRVTYEGPGPFEVLLGNVDAVSGLQFMGEDVDVDQYPASAGRTQFVLEAANG